MNSHACPAVLRTRRLLFAFLLTSLFMLVWPLAAYADEPIYGFETSGYSFGATYKTDSVSKRVADGTATFDVNFYYNASEDWAKDISFELSDVTPAAYREMFNKIGAETVPIAFTAGLEVRELYYYQNGTFSIIRPFPEGSSDEGFYYATDGTRISVTVGYSTRAVKVVAKKNGTVLDTLYVMVLGFDSNREADLDREVYAYVRQHVEKKLWTDDMSNADKLAAVTHYINTTTHYPGTDATSEELNSDWWQRWAVDGKFLYYGEANDTVLNRIMRFQGGITTCQAADTIVTVGTDDLGLPYLYDSENDVVLDKEGIWYAMGSYSSAPYNPWHETAWYKYPDLSVLALDAQGMDSSCASHSFSCNKIVDLSDAKMALAGIFMEKDATTLAVGASEDLRALGKPAFLNPGTLVWASNNPAVATVDAQGCVKALVPGKATITAQTADGAFSASCEVTVEEATSSGGSESGSDSDSDQGQSASPWVRIAGNNQYDTMAQVAQEGWEDGGAKTVVLATGENFPDALAAAGVAGLEGAPVVITTTSNNWLCTQARKELERLQPEKIIAVGGIYAMPQNVIESAREAAGAEEATRLWGDQPSDTAAAMNLAYKDCWGDTAFLATSLSYPDALSAAPLAYAKHMPIFLVDHWDKVTDATYESMKACGIKNIIVLGGRYCISDVAKADLAAHGLTVTETLAGENQYDTSLAIANWGLAHGMSADQMGVACGLNYPDALTGAAFCGKNNAVMVLADSRNHLTCSAIAEENADQIEYGYVFGGIYAVPPEVMAYYESAAG